MECRIFWWRQQLLIYILALKTRLNRKIYEPVFFLRCQKNVNKAFNDTSFNVEKVHLDDLDVLDIRLVYSDHHKWNLQRSYSTSSNLKQKAFIRRDEDWPEEGWYIYIYIYTDR